MTCVVLCAPKPIPAARPRSRATLAACSAALALICACGGPNLGQTSSTFGGPTAKAESLASSAIASAAVADHGQLLAPALGATEIASTPAIALACPGDGDCPRFHRFTIAGESLLFIKLLTDRDSFAPALLVEYQAPVGDPVKTRLAPDPELTTKLARLRLRPISSDARGAYAAGVALYAPPGAALPRIKLYVTTGPAADALARGADPPAAPEHANYRIELHPAVMSGTVPAGSVRCAPASCGGMPMLIPGIPLRIQPAETITISQVTPAFLARLEVAFEAQPADLPQLTVIDPSGARVPWREADLLDEATYTATWRLSAFSDRPDFFTTLELSGAAAAGPMTLDLLGLPLGEMQSGENRHFNLQILR